MPPERPVYEFAHFINTPIWPSDQILSRTSNVAYLAALLKRCHGPTRRSTPVYSVIHCQWFLLVRVGGGQSVKCVPARALVRTQRMKPMSSPCSMLVSGKGGGFRVKGVAVPDHGSILPRIDARAAGFVSATESSLSATLRGSGNVVSKPQRARVSDRRRWCRSWGF